MRRVLYSAALGVEEFNKSKREELIKIRMLEKEVRLAKNIMESIEQKKHSDPAMIIRLEGKLKNVERRIRDKKRLSYASS